MPRNRSELEPTLDGIQQNVLGVLREDARQLVNRLPNAKYYHAYVTDDDDNVDLNSSKGTAMWGDLDQDDRVAYKDLGAPTRSRFIVNYAYYIRGTPDTDDGS